jgi:hypothetical protein
MKKVYETLDPLMFGHFKNLLENESIPCVTRNEYLASAAGGLPPTECWYEIWVENDLQYDDAENIIFPSVPKESTYQILKALLHISQLSSVVNTGIGDQVTFAHGILQTID